MITKTWNECGTALESALMGWNNQSASWFSKKTWSDSVSETENRKILIKNCPLDQAIEEDKAYQEAGFLRRLFQRSKFAGARSRVKILPYAIQRQNLLDLNQEMQTLQQKFAKWQLKNENNPFKQSTIEQAKAIQADITTVLKKLQDWVNALPIKHRTPLVQTGEPLPAIAKCLNNIQKAMENTAPLLAPKNRLTEYQSLQNLPDGYADIVRNFSKQGRATFTGDSIDTGQALIALSCHFVESLDALWTLEHPKLPDTTDDDKYYMLPRIHPQAQIKPYAKIVERELLYLGRELIKEKTDTLTRKNSLKDTKNLFLQGYATHLENQVKYPIEVGDYNTPVYVNESPIITKNKQTLREIEQIFRNIYYRFIEKRVDFPSDFGIQKETKDLYDKCFRSISRKRPTSHEQTNESKKKPVKRTSYSPGHIMKPPAPIPLTASNDSTNSRSRKKTLTSSSDSISNSPGPLRHSVGKIEGTHAYRIK